jgi:glycosyltransferase 2 family protein
MKRSKVITIIQSIIAIAILLLLFSIIDYQIFLSLLTNLDIWFILLAGFCYLLNNLLMAYRIKKILFTLGENLRFKLVFFSHMAGMLLSDFTPARSGYLYTAIALNKRDVPLEKGISTITSTYLYDLTLKMIVALLGAYFIYSYVFADRLSYAFLITFLLILGVIIGYLIIMYPGKGIRNLFQKREILKKVLIFGEQSRAIQRYAPFILSISLAGWILRGLQWYMIVLSMRQVILTPYDALFLNPLLTLVSLIPLTPAGWGIQEAGIVFVFTNMGISATIAASFALINRFVEVGIDSIGIKEFFTKSLKDENLFAFYNTIPGDIDEKAFNSDMLVQRYFQRRKTEVIKNSLAVEKHDVIIDIGCGSGVQLKEIGETGYSLAIGIDINLNAIRFARERSIPNTEFIIADAQYLPIKSSSADKIICAEIIEHLKHPQNLVNEITRVLKHGGVIVITTPNDKSVWGIYEFLWDVFGRGRNYGETHLRFFTESDLRSNFPMFSDCTTQSLFFISPLFALFNKNALLKLGKTIDLIFERWGFGVSLVLHARK